MKRILISAGVMFALAASAVFAFGDLARPKPSPTGEPKTVLYSGLTIVTDSKASEAKLQISEATLKRISEGAAREGHAGVQRGHRERAGKRRAPFRPLAKPHGPPVSGDSRTRP